MLLGRDQVEVEVHVNLEGLAHLWGGNGHSRDSVFKNCIYVAGHPSGDEFSDTLLVLRSPDRQVTNKTCCH